MSEYTRVVHDSNWLAARRIARTGFLRLSSLLLSFLGGLRSGNRRHDCEVLRVS